MPMRLASSTQLGMITSSPVSVQLKVTGCDSPRKPNATSARNGEDGERDGRLPVARRERHRWCLGHHRGSRCRHLPASSVVRFLQFVVRRLHALLIGPSCTGFGRRKIALTSGGCRDEEHDDALHDEENLWRDIRDLHGRAAAFMAPNRSPAKKMPTAPPAPSRATVMPSKPMPASMLG
jgi:hypothetical protein